MISRLEIEIAFGIDLDVILIHYLNFGKIEKNTLSYTELIASPHFVYCCEKSAEIYSKVSVDFSQQSTK